MKYILIIMSIVFAISCRDRVKLDRSSALEYSSDTIQFDTVFTDTGTRTRQWKIYNRSDGRIIIDKLTSEAGSETQYIINVDGRMIGDGVELELQPGDSVFVFVQARLKESGTDTALIYREYLAVSYSGRTDRIPILSYGQDVTKLRGQSIETQTWSGSKPYLIYDSLYIKPGHTLTINEGVTVFCHAGARIIAGGGLICDGTVLRPVVFKSDNWDTSYYTIPNQWGSIILRDSTAKYRLTNTRLLRGTNGLIASFGSLNSASEIVLENVEILYMGSAGLVAENTNLVCSNTVIGNCSAYSLLIGGTGTYQVTHSTLAKMNTVASQSVPMLCIKQPKTAGLSVRVSNSIVVSTRRNYREILFPDSLGSDIVIEQSVITADTKLAADARLKACYIMKDTARLFAYRAEPRYQLDSLSAARNFGLPELTGAYLLDKLGNARNADAAPDAGAYEYLYLKK